jgi:hypothetical protein
MQNAMTSVRPIAMPSVSMCILRAQPHKASGQQYVAPQLYAVGTQDELRGVGAGRRRRRSARRRRVREGLWTLEWWAVRDVFVYS